RQREYREEQNILLSGEQHPQPRHICHRAEFPESVRRGDTGVLVKADEGHCREDREKQPAATPKHDVDNNGNEREGGENALHRIAAISGSSGSSPRAST